MVKATAAPSSHASRRHGAARDRPGGRRVMVIVASPERTSDRQVHDDDHITSRCRSGLEGLFVVPPTDRGHHPSCRAERPPSSHRLATRGRVRCPRRAMPRTRQRTIVTDELLPLEHHRLVHPDGREFHVYGHLDGTLAGQPIAARDERPFLQRRFDRLTGCWVIMSPARNTRPGGTIAVSSDPCPLCPGGPELPWPFDVAVFDNRFPSLAPTAPVADDGLAASSTGRCQVVVYTPDHSCRSLAGLSAQQLIDLVAILRDRTSALWAEGHRYVMAFENRGAVVGATLDHLHGQLYALDHLPPAIHTKLARHTAHRRDDKRCLGCTLVAEDIDRVIAANDTFSVAVPYAARWPFEVHVRARPHGLGRLADLTDSQVVDLAAALRDVVARYDGLFGMDLPYMMCIQESPTTPSGDWHLHVEFLPPNRSANLLKVRASVETALGTFINDSVPETSAARLADIDVASENWPAANTVRPIVDAP